MGKYDSLRKKLNGNNTTPTTTKTLTKSTGQSKYSNLRQSLNQPKEEPKVVVQKPQPKESLISKITPKEPLKVDTTRPSVITGGRPMPNLNSTETMGKAVTSTINKGIEAAAKTPVGKAIDKAGQVVHKGLVKAANTPVGKFLLKKPVLQQVGQDIDNPAAALAKGFSDSATLGLTTLNDDKQTKDFNKKHSTAYTVGSLVGYTVPFSAAGKALKVTNPTALNNIGKAVIESSAIGGTEAAIKGESTTKDALNFGLMGAAGGAAGEAISKYAKLRARPIEEQRLPSKPVEAPKVETKPLTPKPLDTKVSFTIKKERVPQRSIETSTPTIKVEKTRNINPTNDVEKMVKHLNNSGLSTEEITSEIRNKMKQIENNHFNTLKSMNEGTQKSAQNIGIIRNTNGTVVKRYNVGGTNEPWYSNYFAKFGRKPTNEELMKMTYDHLENGVDTLSGHVPPNQEWINLKKELQQIESMKTTPKNQKVSVIVNKTPKTEMVYKNTELPKSVSVRTKKIGHAEKLQNEINSVIEGSDTWKDKSKLSYKTNTLERNFEDIIPNKNEAKKANDIVVEPIRTSEANSIREKNAMRSTVKQFGIKAGSKESALAQKYGEGKITLDELKASTNNWENVKGLTDYMKNTYSELLDKANTVLQRNGYTPIPKRSNYMPHQGEIEPLLKMLGIENPELPTEINGLTGGFRPGKSWFGNALQRKGDQTVFDAVRGFDNYIEGINKVIHHTDNIQRVRTLEDSLRAKYNNGETHLTNLVSELKDYGNQLAGKKSTLDRGMEEVVGRKIYKIVDGARKQLGANMIGANISSALTNFIPLTQSLATTDKASFIKGMMDTLTNAIKEDGFVTKSDYLTRRFGSDKLALSKWEKVGKGANVMFSAVDKFVSQTITRAKYYEGLEKGLSETEALKQADNYAGRVMADRSLGMTPTLYGSKTLAPFTQFQLEIQNQINWMLKDLPRSAENKTKLASNLTQLAVYSYLYNNLFEKITGRRPAVDPIGVVENSIKNYNNDKLTTGEANKKLIENVASQLPFASTLVGGGRIPLSTAMPDFVGMAEGKADAKKELVKPFIYMFPPTGGGQIKKTIEGLDTYNKGGAYNGNKLKFPVEKNKANLIRSAAFGQYSTPEANKYFDNNEKPLSDRQTLLYENAVKKGTPQNEIYDKLINKRTIEGLQAKVKEIRKDKDLTQEEKAKQIQKLREQLLKMVR